MITRRTPLQSFLTVATHGTVHEAARQLHLTQPAVTRQIKALEEELGGALFTRGVRGMELTRFGETFLHYARQMDQTLRYALNELQGISAGRTGAFVSERGRRGPTPSFRMRLPNSTMSSHPFLSRSRPGSRTTTACWKPGSLTC